MDIQSGNNSVPSTEQPPPVGGQSFSVQGYNAGPGYDLSSGLGTTDGFRLVTQLAGSQQ